MLSRVNIESELMRMLSNDTKNNTREKGNIQSKSEANL